VVLNVFFHTFYYPVSINAPVLHIFSLQIFKSNRTTAAAGRYLNDAILQGIDGLQQLLIYDRSVQPPGNGSLFQSISQSRKYLACARKLTPS